MGCARFEQVWFFECLGIVWASKLGSAPIMQACQFDVRILLLCCCMLEAVRLDVIINIVLH